MYFVIKANNRGSPFPTQLRCWTYAAKLDLEVPDLAGVRLKVLGIEANAPPTAGVGGWWF
jgi:hypothetical protein